MKIVTFIGSSRNGGNSELLTDIVLKDITHKKIYLKDLDIRPIEDLRHTKDGFQVIKDDYDNVIEELQNSDIVIFATPIYWYSMSGIMKNMVDRFSQSIRDNRFPDLKERLKKIRTIVVIVGGDKPRIKGLPLIQQFQYTFEFLEMSLWSYIIGEANKPGEIMDDKYALSQAALLNENIKSLLYKEGE
ncbi:flavodoxin family protein [Lysinibacillus sp. NPDC093197]|uniref:flavodoxin family protein n=1 Tax=Lysinibacillus sp. NPDC093197 TaxID=3364132 RepID=UPI003812FDCA